MNTSTCLHATAFVQAACVAAGSSDEFIPPGSEAAIDKCRQDIEVGKKKSRDALHAVESRCDKETLNALLGSVQALMSTLQECSLHQEIMACEKKGLCSRLGRACAAD